MQAPGSSTIRRVAREVPPCHCFRLCQCRKGASSQRFRRAASTDGGVRHRGLGFLCRRAFPTSIWTASGQAWMSGRRRSRGRWTGGCAHASAVQTGALHQISRLAADSPQPRSGRRPSWSWNRGLPGWSRTVYGRSRHGPRNEPGGWRRPRHQERMAPPRAARHRVPLSFQVHGGGGRTRYSSRSVRAAVRTAWHGRIGVI